MYLGRIVELAETEALFANPHHPYTRALLKEIPTLEPKKRAFTAIKGEMPSPLHPRPAATFTRAVEWRGSCVPLNDQCCAKRERCVSPPAILPKN